MYNLSYLSGPFCSRNAVRVVSPPVVEVLIVWLVINPAPPELLLTISKPVASVAFDCRVLEDELVLAMDKDGMVEGMLACTDDDSTDVNVTGVRELVLVAFPVPVSVNTLDCLSELVCGRVSKVGGAGGSEMGVALLDKEGREAGCIDAAADELVEY